MLIYGLKGFALEILSRGNNVLSSSVSSMSLILHQTCPHSWDCLYASLLSCRSFICLLSYSSPTLMPFILLVHAISAQLDPSFQTSQIYLPAFTFVSSDVLGCSVPVPSPRTKCLTWACAGLQLKQWIEISVELLPCHWRFCLVGNVWWKLTSESSYHFLSSNPFSSMWVLVDVLDLFHNPFLHF